MINDLFAPYLLKKWVDCHHTCKDKAFHNSGCIIDLLVLTLTLFTRSYADSFLK